jgi:triphosphoribosyl-dephospho-CoA synthetase
MRLVKDEVSYLFRVINVHQRFLKKAHDDLRYAEFVA